MQKETNKTKKNTKTSKLQEKPEKKVVGKMEKTKSAKMIEKKVPKVGNKMMEKNVENVVDVVDEKIDKMAMEINSSANIEKNPIDKAGKSRSKAKNQPKYLFKLLGVDIADVDQEYGLGPFSRPEDIPQPINTTRLSDLRSNKNTEMISFLDESKTTHMCQVSMIDYRSQENISSVRYHCFWCRSPFGTKGIGCPVKYVASQALKRHKSEITKDTYTIKENITAQRKHEVNDDRIEIQAAEYYETDGIFCSFNCCQAWINDNKHCRLYDDSQYLLIRMYNGIMGTKLAAIMPAPHWRLLSEFGGYLTLD